MSIDREPPGGMPTADPGRLRLPTEERRRLWEGAVDAVGRYLQDVDADAVAPLVDVAAIREALARQTFERPVEPLAALSMAVEGLRRGQVHTAHRRYFGLFNPTPTDAGIAADLVVAGFNPQLAAWSHNPFAVEVEDHLVRSFAARFGFDASSADGTFASGGAEANHTAVLAALESGFPDVGRAGLRGLGRQPTLYVSREGHHSVHKAARVTGLGAEAVREVRVDPALRMEVGHLEERIAADRAAGLAPFLVVATAGTTSAGAIDPLVEIASVARREGVFLHVDAAWGGAAALVEELRPAVSGIAQADSITFDAHKWLSVPMGAGLFLTRHRDLLHRTFSTHAAYMPRHESGVSVTEPHSHSLQWSRRFIGLKVFLSLLIAGWEGYGAVIRRQTALGRDLREKLAAAGWRIVNDTPLPVVCFVDATRADGASAEVVEAVARGVVGSGEAWISATRVGDGQPVLRACVTSFRTRTEDLDRLIALLDRVRRSLG
jgi:glutamate/tyrosine decarboxylase-like PLP-dependent enzyme